MVMVMMMMVRMADDDGKKGITLVLLWGEPLLVHGGRSLGLWSHFVVFGRSAQQTL